TGKTQQVGLAKDADINIFRTQLPQSAPVAGDEAALAVRFDQDDIDPRIHGRIRDEGIPVDSISVTMLLDETAAQVAADFTDQFDVMSRVREYSGLVDGVSSHLESQPFHRMGTALTYGG